MRSLAVLAGLLALSACALGSGWVGQKRVNPSNGEVPDGAPAIAVGLDGNPWVVWDTRDTLRLQDTTLVFSVWQGESWGRVCGVGPNRPDVLRRLNATIAFDTGGRAWLCWDNKTAENRDDIGSSVWANGIWSDEVRVDRGDSAQLDFRPRVACGGGQVWCVWFGGPTDVSPYSIYASRWDSVTQGWLPEIRVSPPNGNNNWWCDVAVDAQGKPHVVWTETEHLAIYYSFYDGAQWSEPLQVNDSSLVKASAWPAPRIVIDRDGVLHMSYTGVLNGAPARDEFYTRNDGSGWTPSVRVTQDTVSNYNEWYSDIAASSSDNVWIAFERQGEGSDQFRIYAVHFDGQSWSAEQRLDNDSAYYDGSASICLVAQGEPWVVWEGISYESGQSDVFYNRIADAGCSDEKPGVTCEGPTLAVPTCNTAGPVKMSYDIRSGETVRLEVFNLLGRRVATLVDAGESEGRQEFLWDATKVPAGTYFCRLTAGKLSVINKIVLMGQ